MKKGVLSGVLNGDKRTGLDIHILKGVGLVREVFEGRFEGRRVRGRRRRGLLDGLKNGGNYVDLQRRAKDRITWKNSRRKPAIRQNTNDDDDDDE